MKRISIQKFKKLSPEEIGNMNKKEIVDLLKNVREKLDTRLNTFSKQSKNFYSPAQQKILEYYEENRQVDASKISRNRAMNEIFQIQSFFQARTGTVKGAREVMREQDIRIFGINEKTGRAKHTLNRSQRDAFWALYDEFLAEHKNAIAMFESGKIQQFLGERVIAEKGRKLDYKDSTLLEQIYNDLLKRRDASKGGSYDNLPNVFTGRRNN